MHPNQPPKNDRALAYATFLISGDTVDPIVWTRYFGVEPDKSTTKGQPFILPSGKLSPRPGKLGLWGACSKSAVYTDTLEPHLRYLIRRLGLPRDDLRERVQHAGAQMRFLCYWFNEAGDRVPDIAHDIREMMESLGGAIEIDEYR